MPGQNTKNRTCRKCRTMRSIEYFNGKSKVCRDCREYEKRDQIQHSEGIPCPGMMDTYSLNLGED